MSGGRGILTGTVVLSLALVTSGCSRGLTGDDPTAPASPGRPSSSSPADGAPPTPPGDAPAVETPRPGDEGPIADVDGVTREQLIEDADEVVHCDDDLTISDDGASVYVEGPCDRLILTATDARVAADHVGFLKVVGDADLVLSRSVDRLVVTGDDNVVRWRTGTPSVQDEGSSNTLTAG